MFRSHRGRDDSPPYSPSYGQRPGSPSRRNGSPSISPFYSRAESPTFHPSYDQDRSPFLNRDSKSASANYDVLMDDYPRTRRPAGGYNDISDYRRPISRSPSLDRPSPMFEDRPPRLTSQVQSTFSYHDDDDDGPLLGRGSPGMSSRPTFSFHDDDDDRRLLGRPSPRTVPRPSRATTQNLGDWRSQSSADRLAANRARREEREALDEFLSNAPSGDFERHERREASPEREVRLRSANLHWSHTDGPQAPFWTARDRDAETARSRASPLVGGLPGRDILPDYDNPGPVRVRSPRNYPASPSLRRPSSIEREVSGYGNPPVYEDPPRYLDDIPGDRPRGRFRDRGGSMFGFR